MTPRATASEPAEIPPAGTEYDPRMGVLHVIGGVQHLGHPGTTCADAYPTRAPASEREAALPADAERALLDYWWNHGGGREALDETNTHPLAHLVLRDLRLALAARCPTEAAERCTVDHAAALAAHPTPPPPLDARVTPEWEDVAFERVRALIEEHSGHRLLPVYEADDAVATPGFAILMCHECDVQVLDVNELLAVPRPAATPSPDAET